MSRMVALFTFTSGQTVNGKLIVGTGNAGQMSVSAPTLAMDNGGTISVGHLEREALGALC